MFADPQSVTINAVTTPLALVKASEAERSYANAEGTIKLQTKQNRTKTRMRHEVRLTPTIVAVDPLSSANDFASASVYLVIDEPLAGFTDVQLGQYVEALKTWLTSANQAKLFAGEM